MRTPDGPSVKDELAAIRAGDESAFEAVFREYYGRLCAYAARIVGSDQTAEDLVQAALLRLWQGRETIEVSGTLMAYLYGIIRNGALMHLRRERLERRVQEQAAVERVPLLMGAPAPRPDCGVRSAELSDAIEDAIRHLPPRCREAFALRREHYLSYAEIARVMGISRKTVEVQIGAALKRLRQRLADWI